MQITSKKLPKNQMELTIELTPLEISPFLESALERLRRKIKIDGFRPGKAPLEIVKKRLGEAAILKEALNDIIEKTYIEAIAEKKLEPIEAPKIEIIKIAPGNPLSYKATFSLLPRVTIKDVEKVKVTPKKIKIDEKKVDQTLKHLAQSRSKEKLVNRASQDKDIIEVDMELFQNNVPIEGGIAKGHKIIIGEPYYIPGLEKKLKNLKASDEKKFEITFPKNHYNKKIAGKPVQCKIKVKGVYEREIPKINDQFAQSLGKFKNLKKLKEQIKNNLQKESETKETERQELEMIDQLIQKAEFDEIPEILLKEEVKKMIKELKTNLANQGIKLEDYLTHLKKSAEELEKDFIPQAEKRVKTGLFIREYAQKNKISATDQEVEEEIKKLLKYYPNNPEIKEQIQSEDYKNYLKMVLTNRKVIKKLKEKIIKSNA